MYASLWQLDASPAPERLCTFLSVSGRSLRLCPWRTRPANTIPPTALLRHPDTFLPKVFDSIVVLKTSAGNKRRPWTPPDCDHQKAGLLSVSGPASCSTPPEHAGWHPRGTVNEVLPGPEFVLVTQQEGLLCHKN